MEKQPSQVVWGLVDGMEVLRYLAASPGPVTGVNIARTLGLSPVRVSRLLTTLRWMGITRRDPSGRYMVAAGIHALATQNMASSGLMERVIHNLSPLSDSPYTVACGVLWRDRVSFLYFRNPGASAIEGIQQWNTSATTSSIGMALLAHRSDAEIRSLYDGRTDIPGLYPTTAELLKAINRIRRAGYAALRWETHTSLAVPVGEPPYTAIAVSGFQTAEEERAFLERLRTAAQAIARHDHHLDRKVNGDDEPDADAPLQIAPAGNMRVGPEHIFV